MADRVVRSGDVAVMRLSDGGFGACQVTGADGDVTSAYALRWHSVDRPSLDELHGVEPLRLDHHAYDGRLAHLSIGNWYAVPPRFAWIGSLPVPDDVPALSNTYSDWQALADDVVRQRRWDRELPGKVKSAYRAAGTRGQVDVDFGAGAATLGAATSRLDLNGEGSVRVPTFGPVRWSALDQLPRCTALSWVGPDRGLARALAERPVVSSLTWWDAPPVVDLADSGLQRLSLRGADVRKVRLPRGLHNLELAAVDPSLAVYAADDGRWLHLTLADADAETTVPAGLHGVREVSLDGPGTMSAGAVRELKELESLRILWRKPPGRLVDAAALAGLPCLAVLELVDGYGLDTGTLPDLTSLTKLSISGLRRSIVPALKARYRGAGVGLVIEGAKHDTWLAANLNNPFRDWVDDDARGGAAACKAYASTVRAIDKVPQDRDRRPDEVKAVMRTLVEALNGIEQKYEIIDTLRREEACDVFMELATRADVPPQLANQWLDEWRDF
ncbi:hypothetical protein O7631_18255 [Micromonospora sp. WMMD967]|uniref:hypothetical protein n=1 Tax=Micromonospora sp. WMMD967 TaxID=3016101 RepID=UPI002416FD9E|nr:hypothetical protein [Micromonospora sp. WMMD967]MDG4838462.1 hypothetical protein [Micromonospora sp. WMMD967]